MSAELFAVAPIAELSSGQPAKCHPQTNRYSRAHRRPTPWLRSPLLPVCTTSAVLWGPCPKIVQKNLGLLTTAREPDSPPRQAAECLFAPILKVHMHHHVSRLCYLVLATAAGCSLPSLSWPPGPGQEEKLATGRRGPSGPDASLRDGPSNTPSANQDDDVSPVASPLSEPNPPDRLENKPTAGGDNRSSFPPDANCRDKLSNTPTYAGDKTAAGGSPAAGRPGAEYIELAKFLCSNDSDCPSSAFCHLGQRHCVSDCGRDLESLLSRDELAHRCSPRGRITTLPPRQRGSEAAFYSLADLPRTLNLGGQSKIDLNLQHTSGPSTGIEAEVFASPGLEVSCSPSRKSDWSDRCNLAWSVHQNAMTGSLDIRAIAGHQVETEEIYITSPHLRPILHRVEITDTSKDSPIEQHYVGQATDAAGSTSGVAVVARLQKDILTLSDSERIIFGSRPLQFKLGADASGKINWLQGNVLDLLRTDNHRWSYRGIMTAIWTARNFMPNPENDTLSGEIAISYSSGESIRWRLVLYPTTSSDLDVSKVSLAATSETPPSAARSLVGKHQKNREETKTISAVKYHWRKAFRHLLHGGELSSKTDFISARFSQPDLVGKKNHLPCIDFPVIEPDLAHRFSPVLTYIDNDLSRPSNKSSKFSRNQYGAPNIFGGDKFREAGLHAFSCSYVDMFIKNVWDIDEDPIDGGDVTFTLAPNSQNPYLRGLRDKVHAKVYLYPSFWFTAPGRENHSPVDPVRPADYSFFIADNRYEDGSYDSITTRMPYLSTASAEHQSDALKKAFQKTRKHHFFPDTNDENTPYDSLGLFDPMGNSTSRVTISPNSITAACSEDLADDGQPSSRSDHQPTQKSRKKCIDVEFLRKKLELNKRLSPASKAHQAVYRDVVRALSTWIDTHSYLASQALSRSRPAEHLDLEVQPTAEIVSELNRARAELESGGLVLMDINWPAPSDGDNADVTAVQSQQMSSLLLRGLNFVDLYIQLSSAIIKNLDNSLLDNYSDAQKHALAALTKTTSARFALALLARLDAAYAKQASDDKNLSHKRYLIARTRSSIMLSEFISPGEKTAVDVPLFFGDVLGTNSRFFASSDFILTQVAAPAVAEAGALYNHRLRDNLTRWMQQGYVEDQASTSEAHRVAEIQAHFGREISALCGLAHIPDQDVVRQSLAGHLDLEQCHINSEAPHDSQDHFRGLIGEAAVSLSSIRKDVDIARSELSDIEERFHLRMKHCRDLQQSIDKDQGMTSEHAAERERRRSTVQGLRGAISVTGAATKSCGFFDTIFSCGANIVGNVVTAALEIALQDVEQAMARSEVELNEALFRNESDRRMTACWSEAYTAGVGRRTAGLHVQRRMIELQGALTSFINKRHLAHQSLAQAQAALERLTVMPPELAGTYKSWLDDDWETYRRKFSWAKQSVKHALDALQYEKQQSLALGKRLAAARTPDALSAVVDAIQVARLPRSVEGRRPEQHKRIVSLSAEGLLFNAGADISWTRAQRNADNGLHAHLSSAAAAVHDNCGRYLGQGIRFVLEPRAQGQCSERVWRVHAMIKGQFENEDSSFAEALLLKNRVFNSQWCVPEHQTSARQYGAAARFSHAADLEGITAPRRLHYTHTSAHLQPRRDMPGTTFATEHYLEGSSEALAGQGLFGEYIFVFRTDNLLSLKKIDDVILRFDYGFIDRSML